MLASEPQTGAFEQHSDRALQVVPTDLHVGGTAHVPDALHVRPLQQLAEPPHEPPVPTHGGTHTPDELRTRPEQHSDALRATTPFAAQVERQASVVLVELPTQKGALEQHGVVALPHATPDDRQAGATPQKPDRHESPLQHGLALEHESPFSRHVDGAAQMPALQLRPLQHGDAEEHACPELRQTGALAQTPLEQLSPLQHGDVVEHD